jgi:hypothetical protein
VLVDHGLEPRGDLDRGRELITGELRQRGGHRPRQGHGRDERAVRAAPGRPERDQTGAERGQRE